MQVGSWYETSRTGPAHPGRSVRDGSKESRPRVLEFWVGNSGLLGILLMQHRLRQSNVEMSLCIRL